MIFSGYFDAATKTALHLREYEDKIDPADIYSLLGMLGINYKSPVDIYLPIPNVSTLKIKLMKFHSF